MKYVTLMKLSDEGREHYDDSAELFGKCLDIVDRVGGKNLETYALSGRYDFVTVTEFPTPEARFEARLKMYELGIFDELDGFEAFDMETYLAKV